MRTIPPPDDQGSQGEDNPPPDDQGSQATKPPDGPDNQGEGNDDQGNQAEGNEAARWTARADRGPGPAGGGRPSDGQNGTSEAFDEAALSDHARLSRVPEARDRL